MKEINETIIEMKECRKFNQNEAAWQKAEWAIELMRRHIIDLTKEKELVE